MKNFLWSLVVGALFGAVIAAWFSPYMISWYFAPPADMGVSCQPAVEWGITAYRKVILAGLIMGSVVSALVSMAVRAKLAERKLAKKPQTPNV